MKLSVLSALHNEQDCIEIFIGRITPILESFKGLDQWEIVFINDGSTDGSVQIIKKLYQTDPRIKLLSLSRNFGYQPALTAGLAEVEADVYAIIDVDCEDPPELLEQFYQKVMEGYQVCYGIRSNREEPAYITSLRSCFYSLNKLVADSEVILWMAEFGMYRKEVRDAILESKTTFPFIRTEIANVGFKRIGVAYRRGRRVAGTSHYRLFSMAKFAVAGMLAGSTLPLRAMFYLSPLVLLAFILCAIFTSSLQELANCSSIMSFFLLLYALPSIGLYVARTYKNVTHRPIYVIDRSITVL